MTLRVGQTAPVFSLPDQDGNIHQLKDYRGGWVLLYFYPKDDTPGCTKEACDIRDRFPDFRKLKIQVLGVSVDPVKMHKKFSGKYHLPFTLLSDEQKTLVKQYGVWGKKKFMGREYDGTFRTSFFIDPSGKIAHIYEKVKPETHAEQILEYFAPKKPSDSRCMKVFVKANPGAKQERVERVERVDATHFVVWVEARAEEGAANRAIERALAEYFGAPVASVRIVRGHSGREKIVEV